MAKPQVTLRQTKGTPLSYAELDTNFTNLRNATISVDADGTVIVLDLNDTLTLTPGDNVTFAVAGSEITINSEGGGVETLDGVSPDVNGNINLIPGTDITLTPGTNSITINSTAGGIANVIEDTTPQLGGTLDTNNNAINNSSGDVEITDNVVFTSNGLIRIASLPGSNRIECTGGIIIGKVQSHGGTVVSSINIGDSLNFESMSIGAGLDESDRINMRDVIVLAGTSTTERNNIDTPQNGMMMYNTSTHKFQGYANGVWVDLH